MKSCLALIGVVVLAVILISAVVMLEGWLAMLVWNYAVCGIFTSAIPISYGVGVYAVILIDTIAYVFQRITH